MKCTRNDFTLYMRLAWCCAFQTSTQLTPLPTEDCLLDHGLRMTFLFLPRMSCDYLTSPLTKESLCKVRLDYVNPVPLYFLEIGPVFGCDSLLPNRVFKRTVQALARFLNAHTTFSYLRKGLMLQSMVIFQ